MTAADHAPVRLRRKPAEKAARAVLPAAGAAWTAAEIMHVTGIPWLDLALGTTAAAGVVYGKGARRGAKWVLLAGSWTTLAATAGPLTDPVWHVPPLTAAWAVLSFCGWRSARRHPAVIAARDKRLAAADWLAKRHRWGLDRTHLLDFELTRLGERYLVDVRGTGKRASAIAGGDVAERIAEDEMLPPGRVRVTRHRLAGRVEISIRRTDPWAKPIPHPLLAEDPEIDLSGPYSITQPAVVGQDPETGRPLSLLLCIPTGGRNVNVVATLDSGKTTLANCISERVTKAPDALLFRINLSIKGDEERGLWGPACHLTAFGPREMARARKVLAVLSAIVEWRAQQPKTRRNWMPSPGDPHLVLIADEIDTLTEDQVCRRYLEHLNSKGRQYGYTSVRLGQRGTAEWTGGGNVRAVDGVICLGRVNRSSEAMHAAGELGLHLPDMAEYGEGQKGVWAIADLDVRGHAAGRGFDLGEPEDIRRIVAERAWTQPELQPELKTFLGESYENLLRTDVFARWARDQQERPVIAHPRPDMPPEPAPDGIEAAPSPVPVLTDDPLNALDAEAEDALPDDLRARWRKQGEKLDEIRRTIAETAAMPVPDIPHDQLVAHAESRWRQIGEKTVIPGDHRRMLLAMLAAGKISAGKAAGALGVTPYAARCYLERLRIDGAARPDGKGRGAGWIAAQPPEDGDGS